LTNTALSHRLNTNKLPADAPITPQARISASISAKVLTLQEWWDIIDRLPDFLSQGQVIPVITPSMPIEFITSSP
jgi:hypothetical protein